MRSKHMEDVLALQDAGEMKLNDIITIGTQAAKSRANGDELMEQVREHAHKIREMFGEGDLGVAMLSLAIPLSALIATGVQTIKNTPDA